MAVYSFTEIFFLLEQWGVRDSLLPFLLVFLILFTILKQIHLFGKENKNINMVLSVAIALAVVVPHVLGSYPVGTDPIEIINSILPDTILVILIIFLFFVLLALFTKGEHMNVKNSVFFGIISALGIIAVLYVILSRIYPLIAPQWLTNIISDPTVQTLGIAAIIFILVIYFVTKEPETDTSKTAKTKVHDALKEWLHYEEPPKTGQQPPR